MAGEAAERGDITAKLWFASKLLEVRFEIVENVI
jgi:hypothetical protein